MSDFLSRVESVKCFRGECRVCSSWGWFLGCFGFLVLGCLCVLELIGSCLKGTLGAWIKSFVDCLINLCLY